MVHWDMVHPSVIKQLKCQGSSWRVAWKRCDKPFLPNVAYAQQGTSVYTCGLVRSGLSTCSDLQKWGNTVLAQARPSAAWGTMPKTLSLTWWCINICSSHPPMFQLCTPVPLSFLNPGRRMKKYIRRQKLSHCMLHCIKWVWHSCLRGYFLLFVCVLQLNPNLYNHQPSLNSSGHNTELKAIKCPPRNLLPEASDSVGL